MISSTLNGSASIVIHRQREAMPLNLGQSMDVLYDVDTLRIERP